MTTVYTTCRTIFWCVCGLWRKDPASCLHRGPCLTTKYPSTATEMYTAVVYTSLVCLLYSVTAAAGNFHVGFMSAVLCSFNPPPTSPCPHLHIPVLRNQNWWLSSERQQKRKRQEGEEEDSRASWEEEAKAGGTEGARHSQQPKANRLKNIYFNIYSLVQ